jgi:GTPase
LVRSWTHLERQRGGFGFLGGPGETQIETDRRLIRERIAKLQKALEDVTRTRGLHRKRRQKAPYPVVALVGYTNAGKSTLFNRLSGAHVLVQDQVFATLDPTMRGLDLPGVGRVIVSDTVGFISDLPTQLVAAFRATLEEVLQADILLHVQDCAHPDAQAQKQDVLHVLTELGLDFSDAGRAAVNEDKPILLNVLNKSDALEENERDYLIKQCDIDDSSVLVSALQGQGIDQLSTLLARALHQHKRSYDLQLSFSDGEKLAWLYRFGDVLERQEDTLGIHVKVRLSPKDHARYLDRNFI